ncbi:hypothetical protein [Alkalihalobacillus sp. TS-13]|uniref:hypothetical protein n=1 Tax=Alkalihalobacillus sp. TS-13 TaxID=2842455 RepID=UPI001C8766B7|nr:hypothetical protein [Alkalihalobacillus sp. TS-13]
MLEAIFELLMQNIFFVILVIGGILSFFKRQIEKQNEHQQPKRRPQQNQQQPRPVESRPARVEEKTRSGRQWKERGEKISTDLQELYHTKREELEKTVHEHNTREYMPRESRLLQPKPKPKPKLSKSQVLPNPDNVAQGVIWAEVLGPPRSRKPHPVTARLRQR